MINHGLKKHKPFISPFPPFISGKSFCSQGYKKIPAATAGNGSIAHQTCFNIAAYSVYVEKDAWIMLYDFSQAVQAEALMSCLRR